MRLIFITGSSGVGKSTIVPILKNSLPAYAIHDFDEKLTKEVSMDAKLLDSWRKDTTKFWIKRAEENAKSGKLTIVIGLVYPKEVAEIKTELPISFYLLDVSEDKIKERLMGKRFSTEDRVAGLKQATGKTPEEFIEENKKLMEQLRQETASVGGTILDTTNDTQEETAQKVIQLINEK